MVVGSEEPFSKGKEQAEKQTGTGPAETAWSAYSDVPPGLRMYAARKDAGSRGQQRAYLGDQPNDAGTLGFLLLETRTEKDESVILTMSIVDTVWRLKRPRVERSPENKNSCSQIQRER